MAKIFAGSDAEIDSTLEAQYRIAVSAYRNGQQNCPAFAFTKIEFNAENFDTGNNFDAVTNFRFDAPQTRPYFFSVYVTIEPQAGDFLAGELLVIRLYKNVGATLVAYNEDVMERNFSAKRTLAVSRLLYLNAADYIYASVYTSLTAYTVNPGGVNDLNGFDVFPVR